MDIRAKDKITLHTNSNPAMTIDSSGNVGIGTTNPDEPIHVAKSTGDAIIAVEANDGNAALYLTSAGSGKDNRIVLGNAKDLKFEAQAAGSGQGQGQDPVAIGTTIMTLTNSGNLGIGVSPSSKLQVAGTIDVNTASSGLPTIKLSHTNTGADNFEIKAGTTGVANSGFSIRDVDASENRLVIDSSGNVFLSKNSASRTTVGHEFHSSGFARHTAFEDKSLEIVRTSTTGEVVEFFKDSTQVGDISITASATAYNTSSDYRLKENVVEMTGALDRVDQLKPSRFNFIADADTTVDGFLAHEVADVVPEAITGKKDAIDDEGNPMYQGIDQSKLVPLLVGAIQELRAEIEQLKNQ